MGMLIITFTFYPLSYIHSLLEVSLVRDDCASFKLVEDALFILPCYHLTHCLSILTLRITQVCNQMNGRYKTFLNV